MICWNQRRKTRVIRIGPDDDDDDDDDAASVRQNGVATISGVDNYTFDTSNGSTLTCRYVEDHRDSSVSITGLPAVPGFIIHSYDASDDSTFPPVKQNGVISVSGAENDAFGSSNGYPDENRNRSVSFKGLSVPGFVEEHRTSSVSASDIETIPGVIPDIIVHTNEDWDTTFNSGTPSNTNHANATPKSILKRTTSTESHPTGNLGPNGSSVQVSELDSFFFIAV